jgi:glycosidase
MYDTMREVTRGNLSAHAITNAWQQTDDIGSHMLYFLENHDEQRVASDFFAADGHKGVPALIASVLMQQNPFMLYAGQEYGERGMDSEGFSGHDGRTTIFDYWSIDTLYRAAARKLTADEKALSAIYNKVLGIARTEKAVSKGKSFDLMYVNPQLQRQYAFLRKAGSEILLVVVNFSDQPTVAHVNLPSHAFDYLNITEGQHAATDLMSEEDTMLTLQRDNNVEIEIAPWSGKVYKLTD